MHACGSLAGFGTFEQEHEGQASEAEQAEQPEILYERPKTCLTLQGAIKEALSLHLGQERSALGSERFGHRRKPFGVGWVKGCQVADHPCLVDLPVGVFAVLMVQAFVEDPPYIKHARIERIDFTGFALLAVWLGTLQIILDKGQQEDWFGSVWIRWFAAISAVSFLSFVVREWRTHHPIVDLGVLKNRNFAAGVLMITTLGAVLYGTTAALPIFLQGQMGYSALQSGLTLSPRGVGAFVMTFIVGRLMGRVLGPPHNQRAD
jgi:uncharacterized membrane protein (DUF2068 family)